MLFQLGKDMCDGAPFMITPLSTNVIELSTLLNFRLDHRITTRSHRAAFQNSRARARIDFDHMMQDHIRGFRTVDVMKANGF